MSFWKDVDPAIVAQVDQGDAAAEQYLDETLERYSTQMKLLGYEAPVAIGALVIHDLMKQDEQMLTIVAYAYCAAIRRLARLKEAE